MPIERHDFAGSGKTPVPQLSIVIPCVRDAVSFEATLASVLQNRPDDCEVFVVQPRAYSDPYQLEGEVVFVQAPADAVTADLINLGFQRAAGSIVHVLSCDAEVREGWTTPAVAHFDDPVLGSVSPLVVTKHASAVVARGVRYTPGGRRRVCGATGRLRQNAAAWPVAGPTLTAGFYRREAVLQVGGFCRDVGEVLADVDLALALRTLGWRTVHEPDSIVTTDQPVPTTGLSLRSGREAELLFWRNGAGTGWWQALLCHPGTLLGELVGNLHRPAVVLQMAGRAQGACEYVCRHRHRSAPRDAGAAVQRFHRDIVPFSRGYDTEHKPSAHPRAAA
jgi:cellulose synthase/poly-beta-1,6-N-acetylglucosamine synthase-like glycosyltransferase